jgi:hypothetical protein
MFSDEQEKTIRGWRGSWECYITDPWRHDNIDTDDEYQDNCDNQDEGLMNGLVDQIISKHPELSDRIEDIKNFIRDH